LPAWTLRPADPADAAAIARVHVVARREAYAAFLPAAAIDDRTLAERAAVWTQRLADPPAHGLVAIMVGGLERRLVGFVTAGPQRAPELVRQGLRGEVHALYVLRAAQRTGLGGALLEAARRALEGSGLVGTGLWTFADNHVARRFYARAGGLELGVSRSLEIAGHSLLELAYGWPASPGATRPGR
jgi:GNAT superfamily N-acetyltransferase